MGLRKISIETIAIILAIIGLVGSIIFSYSSFTGRAIADLNYASSNFAGLILFVIGLFGAFIHFSRKR